MGRQQPIPDSQSLSSFIVGTPVPVDPHAQDREAREGFLPLEEKFDAVTNVQARSELAAGSISEGNEVDDNPAGGASAPPQGEQLPMALGGSQC